MRSGVFIAALVALPACKDDVVTTRPDAAATLSRSTSLPLYEVTLLPAVPGESSRGNGINNRNWVAGLTIKPAGERHATLWRGDDDAAPIDLKTLGGMHSAVIWPGINERGTIVGISQTSTLDPLGEEWSCAAFIPASVNTCVGFVWQQGAMRALPTLGGNNGFATDVNNRGLVVGWAETPVHDPTCVAPQVLQFKAVIWDPMRGGKQVLAPFPGDSASAATAINDRGNAVGISGDCDVAVGRFSARRAILWEHGRAIDIGNLGGTSWHTPMDINNADEIVGFSNPPGDAGGEFIAHAFAWTRRDGIRDLGLLTGDDFSQAFGINARGQIVGRTCGSGGCRALIWQNGQLIDLNTRVRGGARGVLQSAQSINDEGEITGRILDATSGLVRAYIATPRER